VLTVLGTFLIASTIALAVAGFVGGVLVAYIASASAGFGCSCIYPVSISLVGEAFPDAQGEAMGFASAGGGLGAFLFPLATAYVARAWGIRVGYVTFIPMAFAVLIAGVFLASAAHRRARKLASI
jgi:MFS family permease